MNDATRLPIVSGAFYPGHPDLLRTQLAPLLGAAIDTSSGPMLSSMGLIVPHAGYVYSAGVAAPGYRIAAQLGHPELVVILGANHTGMGPWFALSPHSHWQTPLGRSPVDGAASRLLQQAGYEVHAAPFAREHSHEVQLPFIQILWGVDTPIVPICIAPAALDTIQEAASTLAKLLEARHGLLIASSDFTHYEADDSARAADALAMQRICALDAEGFRTLYRDQGLTICGATAIELLMRTARQCHWSNVQLVDYATSADVTGDRASVVGYACMVMTKENHG